MKFCYCDKNLVNIDFEADDYLSEDEVFELWDMVDINTDKVPVFEVNVKHDENEFHMYVHISNHGNTKRLDSTFQALRTLKRREFDVYTIPANYEDILVVNFTFDHLQIARKTIYERSFRVCPECGEKKAHPNASKSVGDMILYKFHCKNCGYAYIGHGNGEFIREGDLYADWEVEQMWG